MCDSAGGCGDCGGGDAAAPQQPRPAAGKRRPACMRCKKQPAVVAVRHRDPLCAACAGDVALAKVRGALRLKVGLAAGDSVLLCLSGGHCSRTLLELLRELQSDDRGRPGRSKIAFDLAAAFVEEGAAAGISAEASDARAAAVWASVSGRLAPERFACLRLEDAYLASSQQGAAAGPEGREARRAALHALVKAVPDSTGREDLVRALREALLLGEAARRGAGRLARGDCADRLAARAVACAAKGAGYALPASLHFLDARHGPGAPVWVTPARELMAKDLAVVAHLRRLPTVAPVPLPALPRQASINALAERFVAGLQLGAPSAVHTILATAGKLRPFEWNTREGLAGGGRGADALCAVCRAPLEPAGAGQEQAQPHAAAAACCRSCRQQLLGLSASGGAAAEPEPAFLRLAPPLLAARWGAQAAPQPVTQEQMRAQLADCLLGGD